MKFELVLVIVMMIAVSVLLLSLLSSESSFAYSGAFSGHNVKTFTSYYKAKPVHKISFTFSCDSGTVQSVSFRIYQLNIRNGFDRTINLDSGNPARITLSLPDGGYIVTASGNITTGGGFIMIEGQAVLAVNGKDQSFNIKLKPLEGMA
jgi:hypothetical protein